VYVLWSHTLLFGIIKDDGDDTFGKSMEL